MLLRKPRKTVAVSSAPPEGLASSVSVRRRASAPFALSSQPAEGRLLREDRVLLYVAIAAAALIHVSIAASQICLGLGVLLLLVFRRGLPFPRIWLPLLCFFAWTLLADCVSPDPWGGRAQIRKFFVFLFIPLLYSAFARQFAKVYYLVIAWTVVATASGAWGLVQFVEKYRHAHQIGREFYVAYLERRITGFESHWMTFGALQLSVLSLLLAHLFFAKRRMPAWAYSSIAVLSVAILLGMTRSIWLATVPAVLYLVWFWRPKMMIAVPVLIAIAFAVSPHAARERLVSLVQPRENVDSNEHRIVTFRTGAEMIKAHPWFGLGPEEIARNFDRYVPKDIPRPLPVGYYGHLHNIYLQYAAERGIPGLACMLWFIGLTLYDCARGILVRMRAGPVDEPALSREAKTRRGDDTLFVLHGAVAVTIGVLVGGLFEYNLGDSEVLMMFVAVVGLAYSALGQSRYREPAPALTPSAETVSK